MKKSLALFLVVITLFACKENTGKDQSEEPTQMERVMAVHDEMMPKMSTIGSYIGRLQAQIDSTEADSARLKSIEELKSANQTMMQWMRNFGEAFTSQEILEGAELTEAKQKTLDAFEKSVNEMKQQMNGAIENAGKLLGETSPE